MKGLLKLSIESISHKVVWYVKNTAEIVFFSAAAIMVPILGIKGLKTFNNIDKNIIKPITDVTNALLSDEDNPTTKIGGLVGEVIKKLKEKDTDGKSSIDRVMECVDSVTGIVKSISESLKKQTHEVKVKKSDFPAYFIEKEEKGKEEEKVVQMNKEEEKVVQMNTVEYAMYQLNMLFKEFTAPAYDTDGTLVVRKIGGKDVPQNKIENMIGNISDIIKSAKTVLSDEQTGGKLENYLNELEKYESGNGITADMVSIANQEIERIGDIGDQSELIGRKKSLECKITTLSKSIKGKKDSDTANVGSEIVNIKKGKHTVLEIKKCIDSINILLNDAKEKIKKNELKEQLLNFVNGGDCCNSVKTTLRRKAIDNWTNKYLKEKKMNAPVTSIVFQIMIAVSNMRKLSADFSFEKIIGLLSGMNLNIAWSNNIN